MTTVQLSKADSKILAQVFDPESAPERTEVFVDPSAPADRHIRDATLLAVLRKRESEAIKLVEAAEKPASSSPETNASPSTRKDQAFRDALALLDALVTEHPDYASAHNNRAQLRRWRFGDRNLLCQRRSESNPERQAAGTAIAEDLNSCITLASPARPIDSVAPAQGRVLAQAYTQLGAVLHAASKDLGEFTSSSSNSEDSIKSADVMLAPPFNKWTTPSLFEEEASRNFYLGGLYGNEVAKALAVHTNPHAKLCANIVQEAMAKEIAAMHE